MTESSSLFFARRRRSISMISPHVLRWYFLVAALGIACGLLIKPAPHATGTGESGGAWSTPDYSRTHYDAAISRELADMAWWMAKKEKSSATGKDEDEKTPTQKVSWLFRGVSAASGKRYALIADDAKSPLKRYLPGDSLPGGEVLEIIDRQNIRFSLPGDEKGKDLERKLYAPAE